MGIATQDFEVHSLFKLLWFEGLQVASIWLGFPAVWLSSDLVVPCVDPRQAHIVGYQPFPSRL